MPSDKTPDLSIDEWMTANSDLDHKRLHALGVIMQRWNRAERWLFTIFCDVSGYDEPEAWALVYNLGTPQIAERIRSLLKIRNFATEAPLIENALEVFNVCRQNRNSVTHAWTRGLSSDGQLALASKSKKADNLDAEPFPSSLDDLRRVADEIESLNARLWLLSCFAEEGQPTSSLKRHPVPSLLVQAPQEPNTKSPRAPRPSAASRRSEAVARSKK
jgi:hypothetical protein